MSGFVYLILLAALVAIGPLCIERLLRAKDDPAETEAALKHFADIKALPETTVFDRVDLPRARLRSVPVQGSRLSVVPPPADDAWLLPLLEDDPLRIPSQRVAGGDE